VGRAGFDVVLRDQQLCIWAMATDVSHTMAGLGALLRCALPFPMDLLSTTVVTVVAFWFRCCAESRGAEGAQMGCVTHLELKMIAATCGWPLVVLRSSLIDLSSGSPPHIFFDGQ